MWCEMERGRWEFKERSKEVRRRRKPEEEGRNGRREKWENCERSEKVWTGMNE